jgi:DNA polymerase III alpha subunit (gram-positive type)
MSFTKVINYLKEKGWFPYVVGFLVGCVLSFIVIPSFNLNSKTTEELVQSVRTSYEQKLTEQQASFQEKISNKEKEIETISNEFFTKERSFNTQLASLMNEVSSLSKSLETEEIEIHRPDGSWERRKVSRSTVQQLNQKIAEVKQQTEETNRQEMAKQQSLHQKEVAEIRESLSQQLSKKEELLSSREEEIKKLKQTSTSVVANQKKFGLGVGYNSDLLYKVHADYMIWGPVYIGGDVDTDTKNKNRAAVSLGFRF